MMATMKLIILSIFLIHFSVFSADEINKQRQLAHFIWMGEISCDAHRELMLLGPRSLADYGENVDILMWVPDSLFKDAQTIFERYPLITIKSVNQWLKNSSALVHIAGRAHDIEILLGKMAEKRCFTAQKDLVSFAVMAELGGYYFDCTTTFTGPIALPPILSVKVALTEDDRNLITRSPWEQVDIWAFASLRSHKIFLMALDCHLESPAVRAWDRDYTGQAAQCFGHALANFFSTVSQNELKKISWLKEERYDLTGWYVPELLLIKYNAGLWRKCPELNAQTYRELGITKDMLPQNE